MTTVEHVDVLIIGAGAIGTFILAGLLSLFDAEVTVTDFAGPRLERALRLGATRVVPAGDDAEAQVRQAIPGGADVVIEASGAPGQLATAVSLVRDGGRVLAVGLPKAKPELDVHSVVFREITIDSSLAHVCDADLGPALGAARLAMIAATGAPVADVALPPARAALVEPDERHVERYAQRHRAFMRLYPALQDLSAI